MIKHTAKTSQTGGKNLQKRLIKAAEQTDGAYVTIGVHKGEGVYSTGGEVVDVAQVALWNEFGTKNPDGSIHSPERSFLRSTLNDNGPLIAQWRIEALSKMVLEGWSVDKALSMVGFRIMVLVQNKIKSDVPPPNADSTAERKRAHGIADRTLIETGLMLRSVKYRVFVPQGMAAPAGEGGHGE